MIQRIYRQEESDGVEGCTVIQPVAGPKRYLRVFDDNPGTVEWGWTLHPSAELIWEAPDAS
jgi:hypothetical protein